MRNRRARGHIVDISANYSADTPTPYLFTAVVLAVCLRSDETDFSFACNGTYVFAQLPNIRRRPDTGRISDLLHFSPNFGKLYGRRPRHMGSWLDFLSGE